jgi:hypothetical protein
VGHSRECRAAGDSCLLAWGKPLASPVLAISLFAVHPGDGTDPRGPNYQARSLVRKRAIDWLCNWHTRLSVTPKTAAISFKFMSCS